MVTKRTSGPCLQIQVENLRQVDTLRRVMHELYYGAFKSQRAEMNVARVDALRFPVLEFDLEDARQAGEIRAQLAAKGTPIGPSTSSSPDRPRHAT